MTRDEFERVLWRTLRVLGRDRQPDARNIVENLLDAADAYTQHTITQLTQRAGTTPAQRRQALFAARPDVGHARIDKGVSP